MSGVSDTYYLKQVLQDIAHLAAAARNDMNGRLQDDEHWRAYRVLGSIYDRAHDALKSERSISFVVDGWPPTPP